MIRKERVYSILGSRMAYYIKARAKCLTKPRPWRKLEAWISADSLRIPLKIKGYVPYLGYATASLIGYRRHYRSRYLDGTRGRRLRRFLGGF